MGYTFRQSPNLVATAHPTNACQYVALATTGGSGVTTQQISPVKSGSAVGDYLDTVYLSYVSSSTAIGNVKIFDGTTTVFATPKQVSGNTQLAMSFYLGIEATSTKGFNITASSLLYCTITGRFDH